jgi:hypothetical protein
MLPPKSITRLPWHLFLQGEGPSYRYGPLAAAAVHDTVEDTETTPAELEEHFGSHVLNWLPQ